MGLQRKKPLPQNTFGGRGVSMPKSTQSMQWDHVETDVPHIRRLSPCGAASSGKQALCAETHTSFEKDHICPKDKCGLCRGDPYGTRTHVTAVKGRCLNHLTNGPKMGCCGCSIPPGSGTWIRTGDTSGMNRMLWPTELCRHVVRASPTAKRKEHCTKQCSCCQ